MSEDRIAALRTHLKDWDSEIIQSTYDANLFIVNPRMEKRGDGPDKIVAQATALREKLVELYGEEARKWNSDHLRLAQHQSKPLREMWQQAADTLKKAQAALPVIKCDPLRSAIFQVGVHEFPIAWDMLTGKDFKRELQVAVGPGKRVARAVTFHTKGVFTESQKEHFKRLLGDLQLKQQIEEQARKHYKDCHCYHTLEPKIKASFNWPKQHDNDMARAYQDLVNPLYFIGDDSAAGNGSSASTREYQRQLRNAFDGLPVEDNRETYESQDGEYLVLTDEEADTRCRQYIKDSVWAFRPKFLAQHLVAPMSEKAIQTIQEACEDANEPLLALIKDFDSFYQSAIAADGRGHFMNTYDGKQVSIKNFYIYRTN